MKKYFFITVMLLLATAMVFALPVGKETAKQVASNFVLETLGANYQVSTSEMLESGYNDSYIYLINLKPKGYVLLAADDAATPIIGYCKDNNWNEFAIPEQLKYMLTVWNDEMHAIVTQGMVADAAIISTWQHYNVSALAFTPTPNLRTVAPLLASLWGQGTYYNSLCPAGTPVGCVATAMSQIMKFWNFPTIGNGTKTYTPASHPSYGAQTANFGATTYNWAAMPNSVNSSNVSVATLCYHAGVAVSMDYDPAGSGAYSTDVPGALISYFRYQSSAQIKNKSSYSTDNWDTLIRGQLDQGRPVYYSGSGPAGGHAWVVDGWNATNTFHINWGWDGYYNGYYTLAALNPGGDTFNSGQQAVIDIVPGTILSTLSEGFEGTTFPPTGWAITASTFARSATNFITGAYSARYNVTATGANASGKQLRTTKLTVNASSPALIFKARAGTTLRAEQIKVGYNTTGTGTYTYLGTFALAITAQTFTQAVNTLTPGDYYFVFETYSTNTNNNSKTWIIDDVTGPTLWVDPNPIASLNITSWAAGSLAPGDAAYSGDIFQLSNTGQGTLTISGITNLAGTDYSTNLNTSVALLTGQMVQFGFNYEPLNYGTDNMSFVITTNVGTKTITLTGSALYNLFYDSFENYTDFSLTMSPWTQYDGDLLPTYGVTGYTWLNSGYTGSYMCTNPYTTTPALGTGWEPHIGQKYAACWAGIPATITANNDWLISPQLTLTNSATLSFWAKEYTTTYPEAFKVRYSTTNNTYTSFTTYLAGSATTSITPTTTWTQYTYTLPATAKYFAIQCVSADAFCFMVDDVAVSDGSTPPAPQFGNLSGHVYRYGTTTPIANALITAGTKTAYTNQSGFYQINNLLVGTHSITCNASGQFYFNASASVSITNGVTATQDFNMTWGELAASPTSVSVSLYQGETTAQSITLSNPGGTATTTYAGYIGTAAAAAGRSNSNLRTSEKKPCADAHGTRIPQITASAPSRQAGWFGYAAIGDANYYTAQTTERGNYFIVDDIGLMDGAVVVSQLQSYFYNPTGAVWGTNNKFNWKVYTVASDGTVALVHTSALITLTVPAVDTYILSTYTLPTAITIPAGYDFIVTVAPTDVTTGKPQSLATDAYNDNGYYYTTAGGWVAMGMDIIMDAYVSGTSWLDGSSFSGTITPAGSVNIPLNFNTVGVTAGTKHANMYVYNNANYVTPVAGDRGDVLTIPITLTVTIATSPVAVLTGSDWTTNATVGTPSTSGAVFILKNVGPGNLTVTSATGLSGTPFTTDFNSAIVLAQNATHSFGFTFAPTASGIYNATFTIVTNGGTKTITLKGYGNYIVETFEGTTFPPDGWQSVDNDADTYNWMQYTATGAAHAGLNCAGSNSYVNAAKNTETEHGTDSGRPALTPDNWLITPRLAIISGDELNYWIAAQDPSWPAEHYSVLISTTNNAVASFTNTLFTETLVDGDWHSRTINLNAYAGSNVYIAFRHYACTDQFVLKLDDVLMPRMAAPLTYGNITGRVRKAGTDINIEGATVTVGGHSMVTGIDGNYTLTGVVSDTYTMTATATGCVNYSASVTIQPNLTITHNVFMDYAEFSSPQTTFNMSCETGATTSASTTLQNVGNTAVAWTSDSGVWGGDSFPAGSFLENFEDGDITGWVGSVGTYSDIYGSTTTPYGYNSDKTWVFASNLTTTTQWIATPKIRVQTGDNFSFWYKQFNASDESFNVLVSTTTNDYASFTNTLASIGPLTDTAWTQFTQSLNAYAGSDIYIAFYYPRTDAYQYGYIMLDDIGGGIGIMPPTEWLSCAPATGTLNGGGSVPFALNVNAATLPVGNYTAQTWVFGDATNSPYKLSVNLTVTPPAGVDAPLNPVTETYPTYVAVAWDAVDGASSYHIYVCDTPYGTYQPLMQTSDPYAEIPWAQVIAMGFPAGADRVFFRVTADTAARRSAQLTSVTKQNSSQPLDRLSKPGMTRVLFKNE